MFTGPPTPSSWNRIDPELPHSALPNRAAHWSVSAFVAVLLAVVLSGCGGSNSDAAESLISRAGTELPDSHTSVAGKVVGKDGSPPEVASEPAADRGGEQPAVSDTGAPDGASALADEEGSGGDGDQQAQATQVAVALTPGLTPQDAILEAVTGPSVEVVGGDPCRSLTRADRVVRCGEAGALVWAVVSPIDRPGSTVTIYRFVSESQPPMLEPVLQAFDEFDLGWDSVGVKTVDLSGDGVQEVVVGFRTTGSGNFLEIDVVANDGQVVLHRSLHHGEALYYSGVYADYRAELTEDEPNCCPEVFVRETLSYDSGRWSISASEPVAADDVLAGLF